MFLRIVSSTLNNNEKTYALNNNNTKTNVPTIFCSGEVLTLSSTSCNFSNFLSLIKNNRSFRNLWFRRYARHPSILIIGNWNNEENTKKSYNRLDVQRDDINTSLNHITFSKFNVVPGHGLTVARCIKSTAFDLQ